jgi:hypothetical protein
MLNMSYVILGTGYWVLGTVVMGNGFSMFDSLPPGGGKGWGQGLVGYWLRDEG